MKWWRLIAGLALAAATARAQEAPAGLPLAQSLDAVSVAARAIDSGDLPIEAVQGQAKLILFHAARLPALTVGMNNVAPLEDDLTDAAARLVVDAHARNLKAVGADARRIVADVDRLRAATGLAGPVGQPRTASNHLSRVAAGGI
jgi:hypothetical protein